MLREISFYSRMAAGLYRYLRIPPPADPEGLIRRQLENREAIFLDMIRRVVFESPANPYHAMLRLAGCRYEDLAEAVKRDGLETTLTALQRQGVYLTHDEFKGKQPILRSGRHIPCDENSFGNPLVSGLFETVSSGSRSRGTRTRHGIEIRLHAEAHHILTLREFGLAQPAFVLVEPILPAGSGLYFSLRASRRGYGVDRWFTVGGSWRDSGHYRVGTAVMVLGAKLLGARVRFPVRLPPNDFSPVAEWLARRRSQGARCVVYSVVSPAVRVAAAAVEKGLDLRGTLFLVGGEALTDAKRAVIEAAGAQVFSRYFITEIGPIGHGCRRMTTGNCVHIFRDSAAVISRRRRAPLSDVDVDSLLFTTLLPFAPRVLINAEMDDSGAIEKAKCDCAFTKIGFTEQLRDIYSYGKLTGQGTTLVGSDVLRILEEVLPARFGGVPGDYQLVEQEGAAQTQIMLRVSPRVRAPSATEVREFFLNAVGGLYGGSLTCRDWRHTGAVEVIVAEPFAGRRGKVLSLHLLGPKRHDSDAS